MFSTFASGEVQSKKLAARLKKDCGFTAPLSVDNLWLGKQDSRRQSADIFEGRRHHNGSVPTPQRMYGVLRQVNHVLILIVLRLDQTAGALGNVNKIDFENLAVTNSTSLTVAPGINVSSTVIAKTRSEHPIRSWEIVRARASPPGRGTSSEGCPMSERVFVKPSKLLIL